ncbi:hypothetical protein ACTXT7_012902 [Hymenolepis weldensis]
MKQVLWYVRSEKYGEYDLSEHLRTCRENNKYLPGVKIAENVVISDDPAVVAAAADVILLAYATRHVTEVLEAIKSQVKKDVLFVSFSKGLVVREVNKSFAQPDIWLVSEEIRRITGLESMVISGALTARGLANREFCEVTLGAKSEKDADEIKQILQSDNLQLTWTDDVTTVEICGALKNILSVAAGLVDGLKLGANTKSAIIRLGLYEMGQYCHYMFGKYENIDLNSFDISSAESYPLFADTLVDNAVACGANCPFIFYEISILGPSRFPSEFQ